MIIKARNNRELLLCPLFPDHLAHLVNYLEKLSPETKKRFGPHPFDKESIARFYENPGLNSGYIARDLLTSEIVAYSVIRNGYLEHDSNRLLSYGMTLDAVTDRTFAPSVADEWQSLGVGNSLYQYILQDLMDTGAKRIILWGGVQCDNEKAINFYKKFGFTTLGRFEYHGWNFDMAADI